MPGMGESELRTDDVHDALLDVAERVQANPELDGVRAQRLDLHAADRIGDRLVDQEGRRVVVFGGDREVGASHGAAGHPESIECLRARHLVHEVQVNVDEVGRPVRCP